jgi:hypothetical protein
MGAMEQSILDRRSDGHQAIVAVVLDLGRLGYLICDIKSQDGALEITCYPPRKEEGNSRG